MNTNSLPLAGEDSAYSLEEGQKVLNRYVLQRILGRGGMGVVWLARDEALELDVALKFIPSLIVNDRSSLEDLKRETRRNLLLTHPNIVRTYDFVQGPTLAGISMEYVDGDTLRNRRLDQPAGVYSAEELGPWTLQLCEALHYAHTTASIVHRDLKPANLLINSRGELKVADFGIARSLGEAVTQVTGRQTSNGTLLYMSPQQLDGDPADPLDDVYAIGASLYEMITSRPPFFTGELARQIVLKVPAPMATRRAELKIEAGSLPQNWESTIASCLAKERAERPQSVREIAVRLGLREAAALRNPSKALPVAQRTAALPVIAHKLAVTPLHHTESHTHAPAPLTAATAHTEDWKTCSLDKAREQGRAALEAVKTDRRVGYAAAGAAALVLLLAVGLLVMRGHGNTAKDGGEAAAVAKGAVFIETNPPGATVQVDGRTPERTPVLLRDLTTGIHPISVRLDGYEDYSATVDVKANQQTGPGAIRLVAAGGRMSVTTTPPGAEIAVHGTTSPGEDFRYTSPWASGKLPPGEYEVTATRAGWDPVTQKVSVAKGETLPVTFDLTGGTVQINSVPPNATVLVDGQAVGVTPCTLPDVRPGAIRCSVSLDGFTPTDVEGNVAPGQTLALDAKLVVVSRGGPKAGKPGQPGVPGKPGEAAADGSTADATKAAQAAEGDGDKDEDGKKVADNSSSRSKSGDDSGKKSSSPRRRTPKKEPENAFLHELKKIPLPFWRH